MQYAGAYEMTLGLEGDEMNPASLVGWRDFR